MHYHGCRYSVTLLIAYAITLLPFDDDAYMLRAMMIRCLRAFDARFRYASAATLLFIATDIIATMRDAAAAGLRHAFIAAMPPPRFFDIRHCRHFGHAAMPILQYIARRRRHCCRHAFRCIMLPYATLYAIFIADYRAR